MTTTANPYVAKTVPAVLEEFTVQVATGLPAAEIPVRQKAYGLNEVPEDQPSLLLVFAKHFWGLTAFMLEFTIIVSFFLHKYVDVYLISGLMLFNAIIGFAQELKAAKTVKALKSSLQVMVRVLRGGQWGAVAGNQLRPGDIVMTGPISLTMATPTISGSWDLTPYTTSEGRSCIVNTSPMKKPVNPTRGREL